MVVAAQSYLEQTSASTLIIFFSLCFPDFLLNSTVLSFRACLLLFSSTREQLTQFLASISGFCDG